MALINGQEYSWHQITTSVAGTAVNGIVKISYEDGREIKLNWGAGSKPVSMSFGRYEAKNAMIGLHMSEVESMTKGAPGGDLTLLPQFDITVVFVPEIGQSPVTHKLKGCKFLNNKRDLAQSPDGIVVELELLVTEIQWK